MENEVTIKCEPAWGKEEEAVGYEGIKELDFVSCTEPKMELFEQDELMNDTVTSVLNIKEEVDVLEESGSEVKSELEMEEHSISEHSYESSVNKKCQNEDNPLQYDRVERGSTKDSEILDHTGNKVHKCVYCGKCFPSSEELKVHVTTHTAAEKSAKSDHCDELLIELMKKKKELYDLSSPRYSDNVEKKNCWQEIGNQLDKKGSECKERWESIRAQHQKMLNKIKTKSGQGAVNHPKWKYIDHMAFLEDFMKDRTRHSSMAQDSDATTESEPSETGEHEDDSDGNPSREETAVQELETLTTQKSTRRCKNSKSSGSSQSTSATLMNYLVNRDKEKSIPYTIDTFLSLMASTVKKFNPADQYYIKTKVFSLISEVESKYVIPILHSQPLPTPRSSFAS